MTTAVEVVVTGLQCVAWNGADAYEPTGVTTSLVWNACDERLLRPSLSLRLQPRVSRGSGG